MTLDDLYQLRTQVEGGQTAGGVAVPGIAAYFGNAQIPAFTRANIPVDFQKAVPRVEIKCAIGQANGHRFFCPDGVVRYDRWRFTLAVQAVTRPAADGLNQVNEAFLGKVKNLCSILAQVTWSDLVNFPNVRIAEPLKEMGDSATLKSEDGYEFTIVNYAGTLCIRENVWPASALPDLTPVFISPVAPPANDQDGHWNGAAPKYVPPAGIGRSVDLDTGNVWLYSNGKWRFTGDVLDMT